MRRGRSAIADEAALEELLSRPSAADVEFARSLEGDVIVLGAGGKMGPSLARRVRRAFDEAGLARRVIAVAPLLGARGSPSGWPGRHRSHLLRPPRSGAGRAAAEGRNVLFLAGRKFGSSGRPDLTWSQNVVVPAIVAPHFAESRIVVFSTRQRLPAGRPRSARLDRDGPRSPGRRVRADLRRPRARLRARAARARHALPAVPPVLRGRPALRHAGRPRAHGPRRRAGRPARGSRQRDLAGRRQLVRVPWARALCEPRDCRWSRRARKSSTVRAAAERFAELFGRPVRFTGEPGPAVLGDPSQCVSLLGPPEVSLARLLEWVAGWVSRGGRSLGKPTHFESTDGRF